MNQVSDETNQTSSKVRQRSYEIIREKMRPMSIHEIETHIKLNDKDLWESVSKKCSDYSRIIISSCSAFQKYKSRIELKGVDRRTIFYGLVGINYPENLWKVGIDEKPQNQILIRNVGPDEAELAWKRMSSNIPMSSEIWKQVLEVIDLIKNCESTNSDPKNIIQEAIGSRMTILMENRAFDDVLTIFCREISLKNDKDKRTL